MRTMYDSTSLSDIPANAQMVASYVDGYNPATHMDWLIHPNAVQVRIAVFAGTNDGHVLDIETGNATPTEGPGWVQMRRAQGVDPSIYCDWSTWPAVRAAFAAQGVAEPHYWIAYWNGQAVLDGGMVAHQYADAAMAGGHYDLSIVADYWPGVDGIGQPAGTAPFTFLTTVATYVPGKVYDTPQNDRSALDWATGQYLPGDIWPTGAYISWYEARPIAIPGGTGNKWMLHVYGTNKGIWQDALSSTGPDYNTPVYPPAYAAPGSPGADPAPAPAPPPAPVPSPPNIAGVQAAWAKLAGLLNTDVPAAAAQVDAEIAKLQTL